MNSERLDKFNKLISNEKSSWLEDAKWRQENDAWLTKSSNIAVRILREIRKQKPRNGMTQKMLAEAMGVSPQYINKVVKGKENLTLETIAKMEGVLGISLIEVTVNKYEQTLKLPELESVNSFISKYQSQSFAAVSFPFNSEASCVEEDEYEHIADGTYGY